MKRKIPFISFLLCAFACLIGTISNSISWFVEKAIVGEQSGLVGESQGAYFARGVGSSTEPFIINRPIHLYNLAWLQYIGYFNNNNAPFYFALDPADDIKVLDMDGWVLPPIGTSLYPFIGNFNGNGEVIQNLTIDNEISSNHIEKTPSFISNKSYNSQHILKIYQKGTNESVSSGTYLSQTVDSVGLFGYVGANDDMASVTSSFSDFNVIQNVAIDGITVSSSSSNTLIGIVCGYDNASLNKVAVDNATMNVKEGAAPLDNEITTNISDYSLIGYATDSALNRCFLSKVTADLPSIDNPNTTYGGNNWGGSIDMLTIFTRLREIRDSSDVLGYYQTENWKDGVFQGETDFVSTQETIVNGSTTFYFRDEGKQLTNDSGKTYASFNFRRRTTNQNWSSYADNESGGGGYTYALMTGSKEITYNKTKNETTTTPTSHNGRQIYFGTHYLAPQNWQNNSKMVDASSDNAPLWSIPNQGSSGRISTIYSNNNTTTTYYLYNNGGSLAITTNQSTASSWTVSSSGNDIYSGNYHIQFDNGAWILESGISETYYTIYSSTANTYVNYSGTTLNTNKVTAEGEASHWNFSTGRGFYITSGNTTYSLRYNNNSVGLTNGTSSLFTLRSNGNVVAPDDGETTGPLYYQETSWFGLRTDYYYLRWNNGWKRNEDSGDTFKINRIVTTPSIEAISIGAQTSKTGPDYTEPTTTTTAQSTYKTYDSYFPLLMHPTTYEPMDGYQAETSSPKQYNTGYVIGGRNVNSGNDYQNASGDVRFAGYPYNGSGSAVNTRTGVGDSLYNYTNNHKIYTRTNYLNNNTIAASDWTTIDGTNTALTGVETYGLQKLKKSYANLVDTLSTSKSSKYIYGVHFMDCAISIDKLVTIGEAKVLDHPAVFNPETQQYEDNISTYYDYQAPQDSIDFHLKDPGFINFFAGTYYVSGTTNNSFFSLHQITRKSGNKANEIDSIKQISQIYQPNFKDASGNYMPADKEHPYIYKYSDGTYSSNTAPSAEQLIFDCKWIENPNNTKYLNGNNYSIENYSLYYFEIPVNAGEYALGSVESRSGAYLIYLDIGAAATNFKDVTIEENIVYEYTDVSYPKGVDFVNLLEGNASTACAAAIGGQSATVAVVSTTTAIAINYSYSTNTQTNKSTLALTKAGNDPPNMPSSAFKLVFEQGNVDVTYQNVAYDLVSTAPTYTIHLERTLTETYNVSTDKETIVYSETYTISSRERGTKIQLPNLGGANAHWSIAADGGAAATVSNTGLVTFVSTGSTKVESTWLTSRTAGESWKPFDSNNKNGSEGDPIISFHYLDYPDNTAATPNIVISFVYSETGNGTTSKKFYYDISISNTSGMDIYVIIDSFKNAYVSEPESEYILRLLFDETTYIVRIVNDVITVEAN